MRLALLSDIDANLVALQAVLDDATKRGVDKICCLGDIVGVGPDPLDCIELVRQKCAWSLCGDHDMRLLVEACDANDTTRIYAERDRAALKPGWLSGAAVKQRWKWIEQLAVTRDEGHILYVHGSPRDPLQEAMTPESFSNNELEAAAIFANFRHLCFCGHSHRPGVISTGKRWRDPYELNGRPHLLIKNAKSLINVGSVSQQRDGNPASSYVIFDDFEYSVTFYRVPYSLDEVRERFARVKELVPGFHDYVWRQLVKAM